MNQNLGKNMLWYYKEVQIKGFFIGVTILEYFLWERGQKVYGGEIKLWPGLR